MSARLDKLIARCRQPEGPWQIRVRHLSPRDAEQVAAELKGEGVEARVLDGRRISNKEELLAALAKAFAFPGHFGHNWDALLDCLSDFHWLPAKGYVGILLDADRLKRADRKTYQTFLEVCQAAAERWRARSGPFLKVVISSS